MEVSESLLHKIPLQFDFPIKHLCPQERVEVKC